jgi:uncharacterized protein YbjT (DUF2867 family)
MRIAVAAPTGHIGSRVVQKLIAAKADVIVLARKPESLPEEVRSKTKVAQGSLEDAAFVQRATEGADTLFWLTPPNFGAPDLRVFMLGLAENAAAAIRKNHIQRVVNISSHGAGQAGLGPVEWIGGVEKVLDGAAPNTVQLRAGSFMENLLNQIPMLKQGMVADPANPELAMPWVATRDIADAAAKWLLDATWTGHRVVAVSGPKDLTFTEVISGLSTALGKPIRHQRVSFDDVRDNFLKRGASPNVAEAYRSMMATFHGGKVKEEPRTPEATTPTTLDQFAREVLKPLVESA